MPEHVICDEKVIGWRFQQLRRAGYPMDYAVRLSGYADIDLHQACSMLDAGCDPVLAMLILL